MLCNGDPCNGVVCGSGGDCDNNNGNCVCTPGYGLKPGENTCEACDNTEHSISNKCESDSTTNCLVGTTTPCGSCQAGYGFSNGGPTADGSCTACESGKTFQQSANSDMECKNCEVCGSGQIETSACTPTHNTVCEDKCGAGHGLDSNGVCQPCTAGQHSENNRCVNDETTSCGAGESFSNGGSAE